jgi:hypothetical protein
MRTPSIVSLFPSILPGKYLAAVTVFCLLVNVAAPRCNISPRDYDVLSQVMGVQTMLMECFSLSAIPMKIIGELMKDAAATAPGQQRKKKQDGNTPAASTDFSIVSAETRMGLARYSHGVTAGVGCTSLSDMFQCGDANSAPLRSPVEPPGGVGVILLLFFFLLPRSGLDDNAIRASTRNIFARFASAIRVFYCPGGVV